MAGRYSRTTGKRIDKDTATAPEQVSIQELDVNSNSAPVLLEELIRKTGGMDIYFHSSGIGSQNRELETGDEN